LSTSFEFLQNLEGLNYLTLIQINPWKKMKGYCCLGPKLARPTCWPASSWAGSPWLKTEEAPMARAAVVVARSGEPA
jgi:hypothetical protein